MKKGTYKGHRVDFADYAVSFFCMSLFGGGGRAKMGCGATALSLVTGVPPEEIATRNKRGHYSDKFMVSFLRSRGIRVLELTLCNLSASPTLIGRNHVILLSQLFRPNEATWGVIYNGSYFHNFATLQVSELTLLNHPVLTAYLVFCDAWRLNRPADKMEAGKLGVSFRKSPLQTAS